MKKFFAIVGMVFGGAVLLYGLRCWSLHDSRYLSSFCSLEELRASDVGGYALETAFRQNDKDFVGIEYRLRNLPPRYFFRWFGPTAQPCLIFDANGRCVDKTRYYNDDHPFVHRWPGLFPFIASCKCGKGNPLATAEERLPQVEDERTK